MNSSEALTDKSLMPFGTHKGKLMGNVPASYLIWIYEQKKVTKPVQLYIEENIQVLRAEVQIEYNKRSASQRKGR